ncbi:hypothetical protein LDX54_06985 [Lactobacillus sp. IBH004]|uniref:hypothetical protein n=1 Tax=Lactobacillus sp. IBH004 TaxID=2879107 RepID=UPI0022433C15|nr:hypothetical protein [Lactobacillus sp. IBH004]UZN41508.1 hypothetical protein LDX54_06985 [Lactobacillus sp. IBH004]
MTEKRSDYRKKLKKQKSKNILNTIKSAFDDNDAEVDVNPDFTRNKDEFIQPNESSNKRAKTQEQTPRREKNKSQSQPTTSQDKALRLKGKLNRAILIVSILIILVLLALFHL